MLHSIKKLTKHSIVYGIGHIVSRFIGFLLLPIHTNVLPPVDYRNAALLFSSLAILNIIFTYGMDVAFLRFFILAENKKEKHRIFSTAFWMILITGSCFSILMLLFPSPFSNLIFRSTELAPLIRIGGGILLLDALCLIPFLVLRGEERSAQFVVFKSLNIIFNLILNIILVVILKKGVQGIFISNLIASVLTLLVLIPIMLRWLRFQFNPGTLIQLFKFGLPYIPAGLAVIIMDQIGRFFLDRMVGKEATAIFSAGYKLGMFMALVVAAFRFAWHPFFLNTSKQSDAQKVFARVFTYFLFITGLVFLVLSFFIQDIVNFRIKGIGLVGEGYEAGAEIVPLIMLAYIAYGAYANFVIGIYLKRKTHYLPFVTGLGALVNVLSNYLLVPKLNIMGAAWATCLAYLVMASTLFVVNKKLYPIPYERGRIIRLVLIVGLLFIVGIFIQDIQVWYRVIPLLFFVPILWGIGFFNKEEKAKFNLIFRKRSHPT